MDLVCHDPHIVGVVERHPIIDDLLEEWGAALGVDRARYCGHAYRVYNVARRVLGSKRSDDELAVASAFHDLGIWSDGTFDYLAPSIARAQAYIARHAPEMPAALIAEVIENHHRIRRVRFGVDAEVIEAFRRADFVDVSRGWYTAGLDRSFLRELVGVFPYAGFHGMLVRTALSWCVKHPLRPLPMLR